MEKQTKAFWSHVKTFKGIASLDDVFLKWAANANLTLNDAQKVWNKVNADVLNIFNKKADISISGPEEEITRLVRKEEELPITGLGEEMQDMPEPSDLTELGKELDSAEQSPSPSSPASINILDTLSDEDEGSIPPQTEENIPTEIPELPPQEPPMV